jgi:phosphoglycolate phosphatase
MWSGWVEALAADLERVTGRGLRAELFAMMGYDAGAGRAHIGGGLVSTPMARLRDMTAALLVASGTTPDEAEAALAASWRAPDPVRLARPLGDLGTLLGRLHADGRRTAVATTDDREPTVRTLAALGIADAIDALVCADDGVPVKPAGDMVTHLCASVGTAPARAVVVGDSPADLAMGRAAGVALVVGVLTGVGTADDLAGADVVIDAIDALLGPA